MVGLLTIVWAAEVGTAGAADFQPLMGRWQRTDGGYVIEIGRIDADGKLTAGYFNPRPINVRLPHSLAPSCQLVRVSEVEVMMTGASSVPFT